MAAGTAGTTDTYNEREAAVNADIQEEDTTDTHDEKETAVNTDTQEEWMEEDLRDLKKWEKDFSGGIKMLEVILEAYILVPRERQYGDKIKKRKSMKNMLRG